MLPARYWSTLGIALALLTLACAPAAPQATAPAKPAAPPAGSSAPPAAAPAAPAAAPAAPARPAADAPLNPPVTIKIGVVGSTSDAGIYIAQEKGYLREQGLDVELSQFQTGPQMVPPLASGQLDVGGGAPSAGLANALAREIPIRIVADKGSTPKGFGYLGVIVRKDIADSGTFQGCPSFKGWRVGFAGEGITTDPGFDRMMRECGQSISDVESVLLGYPDMPAALRNSAIEAGWMLEPGLTRAVTDDVAVLYKRNDEFYPDQQVAVLMYGPQFIANQRPAAERFMVAYLKGVRDHWDAFAKGINKAEVVDILTRTTVVKDAALYDRMAAPGLNPDGYINLRGFGEDIDWWLSRGFMPSRVDPASVVDHSFVEYAISRLGPYSR